MAPAAAAARAPARRRRRVHPRCSPPPPPAACRSCTTYGVTESFGQIATDAARRAPAILSAPLVPLPGVSLDAGTRAAPAPIRVRGPMLASAATSTAPRSRPSFVTSDLGFLEDGALHVVGRADDVIVTGGAKVHPLEVEAVLAATPGVCAACVFAVPDERWGQIVGAAIAAAPGFDLAAAAVALARRAATARAPAPPRDRRRSSRSRRPASPIAAPPRASRTRRSGTPRRRDTYLRGGMTW